MTKRYLENTTKTAGLCTNIFSFMPCWYPSFFWTVNLGIFNTVKLIEHEKSYCFGKIIIQWAIAMTVKQNIWCRLQYFKTHSLCYSRLDWLNLCKFLIRDNTILFNLDPTISGSRALINSIKQWMCVVKNSFHKCQMIAWVLF